MSYLRSLTAEDGEVRYSRTSRQTPVWVTSQAVQALSRKTLPLARVPRKKRRPQATTTTAPAATATATATATAEPARKASSATPQPLPPVGPAQAPALAAAAQIPAAGALISALL
jgi:hypothetical protein